MKTLKYLGVAAGVLMAALLANMADAGCKRACAKPAAAKVSKEKHRVVFHGNTNRHHRRHR